MRIAIIGGGPAGLYLALLLRKAGAGHQVTVFERNRPDDTFGWGVVFSDQTLDNLRAADEATYRAITRHFAHWDDIDIHYRGRVITSGGHGFSGIARVKLLEILQQRAAELGADLRFEQEITDPAELGRHGLGDADLVIAADGINSAIRRKYADAFQPTLDVRSARYVWLGTTLPLDAFTFIFVENDDGVFQAHAYRFDREHSTFIVECDEASWRAAGFDTMDVEETIVACEALFAPWLDGHPLLHNMEHRRDDPWINFVRVGNEHWYTGDIALIGDAAHTAHFSIGSGTKLAMEDAIGLVRALEAEPSLARALAAYEEDRKTESLRLQNAARNSMEWFENTRRYMQLEPTQFAYSLLTRSQRVSHENLRLRDATYLAGVERWFASKAEREAAAARDAAGGDAGSDTGPAAGRGDGASPETDRRGAAVAGADAEAATPPPMFTPFRLRDMVLDNRIVVAPMDMYSAEDGTPNELHLVHLGARALGGAALVMTEMTCVSPEGRITPGCTGMYRPEHVQAWRRIVDFVHGWTPAKICLQIGHSGRKGSTKLMWEGMDEPLETGGWEVMGPSPVPWSPENPVPRPMTRADMDRVRDQHVRAAEMAARAGFDMIELHCAHGYLLSSFITPISNERTDAYGGSLENRLRYPVEVFRAMRAAWPEERPMSVRISATDWVDGGVTGAESVEIARAFGAAGVDVIHVSTGQTTPDAEPVYGRMFQTPYSDRIKNETDLPTIAVGNITTFDQANAILTAGRADLCALARPHLSDPHWTHRASAEQGYEGHPWPVQYQAGKSQLFRLVERRKAMEEAEEERVAQLRELARRSLRPGQRED